MDDISSNLERAVKPLAALAEEMRHAGHHHSLSVGASKRWRRVFIEQGIYVADWWTEFFEPVRWRLVFGRRWSNVRPVDAAAADARKMLLEMSEWRKGDRPAR